MRKILIILALLGLVGVGLIYWLSSGSDPNPLARLEVRTDQSATIWVSISQQEFQEIGQGQAVFESELGGLVVVRVSDGVRSSQTSLSLEVGQTKRVSLGLVDLMRPSVYSPGLVSYPYVTPEFVYGLNPSISEIVVRQTDEDVFSELFFFNVPKINGIHWYDEHNFVYSSTNGQVGLVVDDNTLVVDDYLGLTALDGTVFLVSDEGISKTTFGAAAKVEPVQTITAVGVVGQIFASDSYLFVPVYEKSVGVGGSHDGGRVYVYSHSGELIKKIDNLSLSYNRMLEVDGLVFMASDRGLAVFDLDSDSWRIDLEIPEPIVDMIEVDRQVYILGQDSGLWQLDLGGSNPVFSLVSSPIAVGSFIINSLSYQNGKLYFSDSVNFYWLDLQSN